MNGSNFKRRRFWDVYLEQENSKCLQAVVIFRMKCQLLFYWKGAIDECI